MIVGITNLAILDKMGFLITWSRNDRLDYRMEKILYFDVDKGSVQRSQLVLDFSTFNDAKYLMQFDK